MTTKVSASDARAALSNTVCFFMMTSPPATSWLFLAPLLEAERVRQEILRADVTVAPGASLLVAVTELVVVHLVVVVVTGRGVPPRVRVCVAAAARRVCLLAASVRA